jgi:hypothetical protein
MRYVLAAVIVVTFPALATATGQQNRPKNPPPSIGLPLPSIGLPLPPIGLDTSIDQPQPTLSPNSPGHGGRPHRPLPSIIFFGAPYAFGIDPAMQSAMPGMIAPTAPPVAAAEPTGSLRIDVEPADVAQIFVDGEYVGTPLDLNGELELAPGRRQIEIRAPGFEILVFDVRIVAGRTISYRGTLQPVTKPPAAASPGRATPPGKPASSGTDIPPPRPQPGSSGTFYLIPGCYLGNVHPDQVKLPPGCDLSRMITHTP